jgi:ribosomal protein L11 methylase PrmA
MAVERVAGSYRDPSGHVYDAGPFVLRSVRPPAAPDFEHVIDNGFLDCLVSEGKLVPFEIVDRRLIEAEAQDAVHVLRHPPLDFISHPYEWSFCGLKSAALFHLDLQLRALEAGITLSDASAYNIQFVGADPIFIDHLSFRPYREGEFWSGHRQFCEQFLNPLLLTAHTGVPFQAWYRGAPDGIASHFLSPLLPWTSYLSRRLVLHVHVASRLDGKAANRDAAELMGRTGLPRRRLVKLLRGLRDWVAGLTPAASRRSDWAHYRPLQSYQDAEIAAKREFVRTFVASTTPEVLWDLGCNTGDYAALALESGARLAIGLESDHGALDIAFTRAARDGLRFLPLYCDATNPSPSQGWAERERAGLTARCSADAVLALALIHHLAISRNVPLREAVDWIVSLAPTGVIEFVPKSDPRVKQLLSLRYDIFADYDEAAFLAALGAQARIIRTVPVGDGGRLLAWFDRA